MAPNKCAQKGYARNATVPPSITRQKHAPERLGHYLTASWPGSEQNTHTRTGITLTEGAVEYHQKATG